MGFVSHDSAALSAIEISMEERRDDSRRKDSKQRISELVNAVHEKLGLFTHFIDVVSAQLIRCLSSVWHPFRIISSISGMLVSLITVL